MRSTKRGNRTSAPRAEVLGVTRHGVWLLVGDTEYHLPFEQYPWFVKATIEQILAIELHHGGHLRWEALDVDLHVDVLAAPERFPLIAPTSR